MIRPGTTLMNERKRRFATAYARLANGTKAAIEAGYSVKAAAGHGSRLLRDAQVLTLIAGQRVNREVHGEKTYEEMILVKNAALSLVQQVMTNQEAEIRDRVLAVEAAGRALERLAKCEGLMIEHHRIEGDIKLTLQDLVSRAVAWSQPKIVDAIHGPSLQEAGQALNLPALPSPSASENGGNGHAGAA